MLYSMCYKFTVGAEHDGSNLRTFLRRGCGITAHSMTLLKYGDGGIYRNGVLLKAHDIVRQGDTVALCLPTETNEITPVALPLNILYEDDTLLIVNKPRGMPVHPTKVHQLDTLANAAAFYQQSRGEHYVFRALNRLDKDTSGCVLIAKDPIAYALVKDTIRKTYLAVCEGLIEESGVINLPIGLAEGSKIKRTVRSDGAPAITHYSPVAHGDSHTLLQLWLETGRTHQIRCHLSAVGHPLAGDDLYGGSRRFLDRQALHCRAIRFTHPITKQTIELHTATPPDILRLMQQDRFTE